MATQAISLQQHQLVALVAGILMTRSTGRALSELEAVQIAKRVVDLSYSEAREQT